MSVVASMAVVALTAVGCSKDVGPAAWYLDPDHPVPTAQSTEIHVQVQEQACNNGEPIGDRLIGPDVSEARDEVVITFSAERRSGANNCFGLVGADPVTVTLSAPLGDRRLVDGGTDPPRQVVPSTSVP